LKGIGFDLPPEPIFAVRWRSVWRIGCVLCRAILKGTAESRVVLMEHILHDWICPPRKCYQKAYDALPRAGQ
jgi:hypothetical protein